jgi:hypothetical protein
MGVEKNETPFLAGRGMGFLFLRLTGSEGEQEGVVDAPI